MKYTSKAYALANFNDSRHVKEIIEYLHPEQTDRILEVGCGRGYIVRRLQEFVPDTHGIDINPESIANGVAKNLQIMSAEKLIFPDESFDKAYSFHTIEHVQYPENMLKELERVLKLNGKALIVYPAEPIRGLFSIPAAIIMYKNPLRTRDIHLHKLNPRKFQSMLADINLKHVKSRFSFLTSPQYFTVLKKV